MLTDPKGMMKQSKPGSSVKRSLQVGVVTDPKGPATGTNRVLRGGSFFVSDFVDSNASSSGRVYSTPTNRDFFNGFRLARTP